VDGRRSDTTLVQEIDATNSNNSYARKAVHAALAAKPAGMVETMKKLTIYISRTPADCIVGEIYGLTLEKHMKMKVSIWQLYAAHFQLKKFRNLG
jgi:hypothetical protein